MKLLTQKHKMYLLRRSRKLFRRKVNRKKLSHKFIIQEVLISPVVLDLTNDETLEFLNKIRQIADNKRQGIKVDFTTLNQITPACALVLASEMHRYLRIRGDNHKLRVVDFDSWNEDIRILFRDMGMFDLLQITNINPSFYHIASKTDTRYIKFVANSCVNGAEAVELRKKLSTLIKEDVPDHVKLQNGLTEAMTNVSHHAYPDDFQDKSAMKERLWWMSASYDNAKRCLNVMFFDHGLGIPKSLPRTSAEYVKSMLGLLTDDGQIVRAATQMGRTKTRYGFRGKGLPQIIEYGQYSEGSKVRICSGKGHYILSQKDGKQSDKVYNTGRALQGTLIEWQINL